jgi:hypothetical protein
MYIIYLYPYIMTINGTNRYMLGFKLVKQDPSPVDFNL